MFGLSRSFTLPLDAPNQCKWLISRINIRFDLWRETI
jgi:hypothetical protein